MGHSFLFAAMRMFHARTLEYVDDAPVTDTVEQIGVI